MKVNLIEKYPNFKNVLPNLINEHSDFAVGDIIEFNGGYDNDIRFTSKIVGFDAKSGIYVIWDCYWFPIFNTPERNISILEGQSNSWADKI